jgi:acyl-CoA thioesterase-1
MILRYGAFAAAVNRRRALAGLTAVLAGAVAPVTFASGRALAQAPAASGLRIAMLGDSLTAGFGLRAAEALPAVLEQKLRAQGLAVSIANHGVSGDTSEGGLQRLDWMLADKPDIVIVALGANDALRGLDPAQTEKNLDQIVATLKGKGIGVLLAGMLAPRNYGSTYTTAFDAIYARVAQKHGVALYPFLLEGVAMDPALNLPDGIHPTAKGIELIADRLAPVVIKVIESSRKS